MIQSNVRESQITENETMGQMLDRLGTWVRRVTPPAEWSSTALSSLDRLVRGGALRITDLCAMERILSAGDDRAGLPDGDGGVGHPSA